LKVYINQILPDGIDIEEELSPADLNLETEQIHYTTAVKVRAHVVKDKDIVTVNCDIKGAMRQLCSKCLSEFDSQIQKDEDFVYKLSGEHAIELDANIRDSLILYYPMKALCKDECKGLCFICGKNLNEGPCGCK